MEVHDAKSVREWLHAWGARAFTLGRAARLEADLRRCAGLVREKAPVEAAGYDHAADVLHNARLAALNDDIAALGPL